MSPLSSRRNPSAPRERFRRLVSGSQPRPLHLLTARRASAAELARRVARARAAAARLSAMPSAAAAVEERAA